MEIKGTLYIMPSILCHCWLGGRRGDNLRPTASNVSFASLWGSGLIWGNLRLKINKRTSEHQRKIVLLLYNNTNENNKHRTDEKTLRGDANTARWL